MKELRALPLCDSTVCVEFVGVRHHDGTTRRATRSAVVSLVEQRPATQLVAVSRHASAPPAQC